MFGWLRRRRLRRTLALPPPPSWARWLDELPLCRLLDPAERARVEFVARLLVQTKEWQGCDGLTLDERMRVLIAAQAGLLLIGREGEPFADVTSILVYPTAFESQWSHPQQDGLVHEGKQLAGEAWYRGPVLLAWDEIQADISPERGGTNVVLHEFAHRLDMESGWVNGTPPLSGHEQDVRWRRVMQAEYEALIEDDAAEVRTVLDPYGATSEAEFFAVATEAFFCTPWRVRVGHPELYGLLAEWFGQDPVARLCRAQGSAGPDGSDSAGRAPSRPHRRQGPI